MATTYANGWNLIDGKHFYYRDGQPYRGWHRMGQAEGEHVEHWSFFSLKTGELYTGWHRMGQAEEEKIEHWSYFGPNGWLRTGWQQLGKGTNNPDGNNPKHWSYFGSNGWLRVGWVKLGKDTSEPDGNSTPHWSYFGTNGWLRTGWQQLGVGTNNLDGNNPKHWSYFGNNGWLRTGLVYLTATDNETPHYSYFDDRGWLFTDGIKNINGRQYRADSRGWLALIGITYSTFVNAYKNKATDYDGVANAQCVDLAKVYLNKLWGIRPGTWGHAYAYYEDFNKHPELIKNFVRIPNSRDLVVQKGDIVVWKKALNGAYGHIAIGTGEGNKDEFYSWDQNWTGHNDPMTRIWHNFNYVAGVLRPKDRSLIV